MQQALTCCGHGGCLPTLWACGLPPCTHRLCYRLFCTASSRFHSGSCRVRYTATPSLSSTALQLSAVRWEAIGSLAGAAALVLSLHQYIISEKARRASKAAAQSKLTTNVEQLLTQQAAQTTQLAALLDQQAALATQQAVQATQLAALATQQTKSLDALAQQLNAQAASTSQPSWRHAASTSQPSWRHDALLAGVVFLLAKVFFS